MNTMTSLPAPGARSEDASAPRFAPAWRAPLVVLLLGLVACAAMPDQLGLMTRIFITALFVLSLDLVVGVAGLATLGHAALFGMGAYAAGIFALHVHPDPLVGLAVGIAAGAGLAAFSGAFLLRYQGFTFLMLTIAVSQILLSLAQLNWVKWLSLMIQAACTLAGIAMVHCDNRRTARFAMGLFSTAVAVCILLILAHDRPFTGPGAVSPAPLLQVQP